MNKIRQTLRYLNKSFSIIFIYEILVILGTVAITDLIYSLTSRHTATPQVVSLTVPFEFNTGIIALLFGMGFLITTFKVTLANGISRKTFLLANLPAAVIVSAVFSTINLLVITIHSLFWPINAISHLIFPFFRWTGFLLFQFALYLMLIIAGWFISLASYRSSRFGKLSLAVVPFAIYGVLKILDASTGGLVMSSIHDYFVWNFYYPRVVPLFLAYAVIIYGLVFLLIRRAPLKQ